jgi:hypothetical protein
MQFKGSKSKFFNLKIKNLNLPDKIKPIFEETLKNSLKMISPSYTNLNKVDWL